MLVLSSPSGAGKTTLSRKLLEQEDKGVTLSVSVTTRKMRPSENDGRDYHFIDRKQFEAMCDNDELLEWAEVFDNYYGTPGKPVMDALAAGRDVLFDIDWQGTQQLRDKARSDLVTVFVLAAVDSGAGAATAHARAGRLRDHPPPHGEGRRRDEPLGGIRLCGDQPRSRAGFRRRERRSSPPNGSSANVSPGFPISCVAFRRNSKR